LRGLRHVVIGLLPEHVLRPLFFIILLLFSSTVLVHISPFQAMALHVLAASLAFIFGALMLGHLTPRQLRGTSETPGRTGPWLRASAAFALATGMEQISIYSNILILGLFEPVEQVGFYRVAFQVSLIVGFGLQTVGLLVGPHFARLSQQSDRQRLKKLAIASARLSSGLAVLAIAILLVWGERILELAFGPPYAASLTPLLILACAQLVGAFFGPIAIFMKMAGHEGEVATRSAIAAGCNIALNFLLIPFMGMEGAALATLLAFLFLNLSLWCRARRLQGINMIAVAAPNPVRRSV
jgi:O-antigen/teichoic acid export membrane protein